MGHRSSRLEPVTHPAVAGSHCGLLDGRHADRSPEPIDVVVVHVHRPDGHPDAVDDLAQVDRPVVEDVALAGSGFVDDRDDVVVVADDIPPGRRAARNAIPSRMPDSGSALACAAASSMASGSPSTSRQISAAARSEPESLGRSGCTRRARSSSNTAPSPAGSSPASGRTRSPVSPTLTRLVTSTRSGAQLRRRSATSPVTTSRRCSQLSNTSRPPPRPSRSRSSSTAPRPGSSRRPQAANTAEGRSDCGPRAAISTNPCSGTRLPTELDGEPRLPAPTRSDERHQPLPGDQLLQRGDRLSPGRMTRVLDLWKMLNPPGYPRQLRRWATGSISLDQWPIDPSDDRDVEGLASHLHTCASS
jgi:hypothetical protein